MAAELKDVMKMYPSHVLLEFSRLPQLVYMFMHGCMDVCIETENTKT